MAGIAIKDVPPTLHEKLKARAARSRRSLAAEILVILERAVDDSAGPIALAEVDAMRVRGARPLTQAVLDEARQTPRA